MRWTWGVIVLAVAIVAVAIGALLIALGSSSTAVGELELGNCFDLPAPEPIGTLWSSGQSG